MKKFLLVFLFIFTLLLAGCESTGTTSNVKNMINNSMEVTASDSSLSKKEPVTFIRHVDGDTTNFKTETYGNVNVRYSGINTPETKHPKLGKEPFGEEASAFTKEHLMNAKKIEVAWDLTQDPSHDRPIGVIYIDGVNLNLLLVQEGWADLKYLKDSMPYSSEYRQALTKAKASGKGMWKQ